MDLCLQNKVIVISGNPGYNVENLIHVLSDEGAVPVIAGNIDKGFLKLKQGIVNSGDYPILFKVEPDQPGECKKAVQTIFQKYGRIDGLVNSTRINEDQRFENKGLFLESLQKNLVQYYLMSHFVLPHLKKSKGVIININFNSEETIQENSAVNAATNGGINALTREWAVELLKYGIRVNAIIIKEKVTEIANVAAFLLSERSSHTTGQLIRLSD